MIPETSPPPLALGGWAFRSRGVSVARVTGQAVKVIPILHPSFILRGQWGLEPAQIHYLKIAKEVLAGTYPGIPDITCPPPGACIAPTLQDIHTFFHTERHLLTEGCAVDIECAGKHLMCVGFCRVIDRHILVVPFRREESHLCWTSYSTLLEVIEVLYDYFLDPSLGKVFQNGQAFDIPYLNELGFPINGYVFDTMLAQHLIYPEMPKSLQFLGNLYLGMPRWKDSMDDEGEGK